MEGRRRGEWVDFVQLAIVADEVRLVMDGAEELAEVIARQVRIYDFDRPVRQRATQLAQDLTPHLDRGPAIGAAHVGDADFRAIVDEAHPRDRLEDERRGEVDHFASAGCRP
jgi:hypothetical protein